MVASAKTNSDLELGSDRQVARTRVGRSPVRRGIAASHRHGPKSNAKLAVGRGSRSLRVMLARLQRRRQSIVSADSPGTVSATRITRGMRFSPLLLIGLCAFGCDAKHTTDPGTTVAAERRVVRVLNAPD